MGPRIDLRTAILALATGCGVGQVVAHDGGASDSSGSIGEDSAFRGDSGSDASFQPTITDSGDAMLPSTDGPAPDEASADAEEGVPCGYDLFDGGPVFCAPPRYCQISCAVSALCVGYGSDASTCPADTVVACPPGNSDCSFLWYSGGAPNDGCCENALPTYTCVDAQPPQTSGDGQPVSGPCMLYSDPNEYVCACKPF